MNTSKIITLISSFIVANLCIFGVYYVDNFHKDDWYTIPTLIVLVTLMMGSILLFIVKLLLDEIF